MDPHDPKPIPNPETLIPMLNTRTTLYLGGFWGEVRSGQTWLATDGERLIWSADPSMVIFSIKEKFFVQTSRGFRGEVTTYPFVEGGRRAEPMRKLAELEMKLLIGIVAGSSGIGFAIVVGTEIFSFVVENRTNFEKWKRQLGTILEVRAFLKLHAPTLYDKVFDAVLQKVWKDVKSQVPNAVTGETVAFGVGVIFGSAGKAAAKGKFSLLGVLVVILQQIVIRFSLNVAPQALKLTADEYAKLAAEIIGNLNQAGVVITDADVRKIVEEVEKNPRQIKEAFDKLNAVFDKAELPPNRPAPIQQPVSPPAAVNAPRPDWLTGVQYRLKQLGLYNGAINGVNDKATKDAVIAFQTSRKIRIDGVPGPQTQRELVAACGY